MKTFSPRMVLIDVDGTLVDSVPDLAYSVDEMMRRIGMPECGEKRVREWVGNGVVRLVERALTNDLEGMPDQSLFDQAMPIFNEVYAQNTSKRSSLYPGVREAIDWLKTHSNIRLGCVTNKASEFTLPILQDLGLANDFEIVICGDTLEKKKPHPMPLLHASSHLGIKPEDSMMLGDSKSDVAAARAAGFSIICMSYGYNHGEDIRHYSPDAVIDNMIELKDLIIAPI